MVEVVARANVVSTTFGAGDLRDLRALRVTLGGPIPIDAKGHAGVDHLHPGPEVAAAKGAVGVILWVNPSGHNPPPIIRISIAPKT